MGADNLLPLNLSALYLSPKRLLEIVDQRSPQLQNVAASRGDLPADTWERLAVISTFEEAILTWLTTAHLPTLEELLIAGRPQDGDFFTYYGPMYGKGIADATSRYWNHKPLKTTPFLYARLPSFGEGVSLRLQVHPENFTSASAPGELGGHHRLFVLGRLTEGKPLDLRAQAYVVGHLHYSERKGGVLFDHFGLWGRRMEALPSALDSFAAAALQPRPTSTELGRLRDLPETAIKGAFAEIIGESFVPKDWAGEHH